MQPTTAPDIKELEKTPNTIPTTTQVDDPESLADITTAPQKQLDDLGNETPKQPK